MMAKRVFPLLTPANVNSPQGLLNIYKAVIPYWGFYEVFKELDKIYANYLFTKDPAILRYLLALCLRSRHGRRQTWAVTDDCVKELIKASIFVQAQQCKNFEDLYRLVSSSIGKYLKNAPLTIYDTALNIAYLVDHQRLCPKNFVYLSAGAKKGAQTFGIKVQYPMPFSAFNAHSMGLKNMEFEDFCCVFHSELLKISKGQSVTPQEIYDEFNSKARVYIPQSRSHVLMNMKQRKSVP